MNALAIAPVIHLTFEVPATCTKCRRSTIHRTRRAVPIGARVRPCGEDCCGDLVAKGGSFKPVAYRVPA